MSRLTGRTASLKEREKSEHIISEREVFLHMALFSPKRKQNRNKSETIVDKAVGLVKKPSGPTPGQIATQNRDISAEIISVLRSIDFAHGRLKDLVDEEEYRTMIKVRDVAMRMLQDSPTIFDEVAQIGEDMSYAAKAWKEAVKIGMPSKAKCAQRAVASGAALFWSNIPEDKEAERSVILRNREDYFKKHRMAIQLGEGVDSLRKELASLESGIKEKNEKRALLVARVQELMKTEEGKEKLSRLFKRGIDLRRLNSEDQKFAEEMKDDKSLAEEINELVHQYEAKVTELSIKKTQLSRVSQNLSSNPDLIKRDLTPEVSAMVNQTVDEVRQAIDRAAVAAEEHKKILDKLKAIYSGESAERLYDDFIKHIIEVMNPNATTPEEEAEDAANRDQVDRIVKKANEDKARQEEKARRAAMEAAKQAQANMETAQAENENVVAESADNFNINY